ncbi:hypothetical protein [Barnesiella intestinihominis]|uniref:hypothetical protein n=1 Tax=Barnesiella intestinihominis TaxID=487174 RepID=UPI003966EC73
MKKIMFNDKNGLTQAVLEGRKTQTRRIIPKDFFSLTWDKRDDTLVYENSMGDFIDIRNSKYALCKAGEIVAVAQSYRDCGGVNEEGIPMWEIISSKVGGTNAGWSNKMYVKPELMPHQIRITNVRVERLQDISDEDCLKEGIIKGQCGSADTHFMDAYYVPNDIQPYCTPQDAYEILIDKVSGKGTWDSKTYVFVYDFELVK